MRGDLVISKMEAERVQREANGDVSKWGKMMGMGSAWATRAESGNPLFKNPVKSLP